MFGSTLMFDVPVDGADEESVRKAALAELQRVGDMEQIRVSRLSFSTVYPRDDWPAISTDDFQICEICSVVEANNETRFAL
jgi:hypothetical protein